MVFDRNVLALDEASFFQALAERGDEVRGFGERRAAEKPDHRHHRLLRTRRERPRYGGAAEQRDELAAFHSITSSAMASNLSGTSKPNAFAVPRLMTRSNLVGNCTGRSVGFSPLRIRPA